MEIAKVEAIFRGERLIPLRPLFWIFILASLWIALPLKETLSKTALHEFRVGSALANNSSVANAYHEAFAHYAMGTRFFDLGSLIGLAIAIGADIFGRKWALLSSLLCTFVGGLFIDLFLTYPIYVIGFGLQGMGYSATLAISIVLVMESIPCRLHPIAMLLFSLSILDHYLYDDILINFGNKLGGHMMSAILVVLTFLIFRFTDESLSFLVAEGTSTQLEEWISRANIQNEEDIFELENHDVNEENVGDVEDFEPTAEDNKPHAVLRFIKSFTVHSVFSLLVFIATLIINFHLHSHFANFKDFNSHHDHTLGMEFICNELPALVIVFIVSFAIPVLPALIALHCFMLTTYIIIGITSNELILYSVRISNTSSILILPFLTISTYPLRHRCTFVLLTLLCETYSEYLDKIVVIHRGSGQQLSWINMFLMIDLIGLLLVFKKKSQPRA